MKHLSTLLAAVALSASPLLAQSAATPPAGAISYTITAGTVSGPRQTALSVPLRDSVPAAPWNGTSGFTGASSGVIAAVAAGSGSQNVVTVTGAGWVVGQFRYAPQPYFMRIVSGAAEGRTVLIPATQTTNTDSTVIIDSQGATLVGTVVAGDKFVIFPAETLTTFFSELLPLIDTGSSTADADFVQIHNGSQWVSFYHNGTQWMQAVPNIPQPNLVLRPDGMMIYNRRAQSIIPITALGEVPTTALKVVVRNNGTSTIGNLFPVSRNLSAVGLNSMIGWVSNSSPASADRVQIHNGTQWQTFYYTGSAWSLQVPNVPNNPNVPVGRPFVLVRQGSGSTVTVQNFPLPYTL